MTTTVQVNTNVTANDVASIGKWVDYCSTMRRSVRGCCSAGWDAAPPHAFGPPGRISAPVCILTTPRLNQAPDNDAPDGGRPTAPHGSPVTDSSWRLAY